ncbi:hypothetical protein HUJ04_002364 [Dendroctonus ponderosae]|nr:hypothetical protein HUJ04_002364 [Dendroctonus ponderosae]
MSKTTGERFRSFFYALDGGKSPLACRAGCEDALQPGADSLFKRNNIILLFTPSRKEFRKVCAKAVRRYRIRENKQPRTEQHKVHHPMASMSTVRLTKGDSPNWGFRLQGGKDFGTPLVIQKRKSLSFHQYSQLLGLLAAKGVQPFAIAALSASFLKNLILDLLEFCTTSTLRYNDPIIGISQVV